jgi:5-methylthioadenosine/S-adenosylhomocysteine deaminase
MTIVDGRIVYENGRCTFVDEDEVMEEAQARADELVVRAGMQELLRPWRATGAAPDRGGRG